MKEMQYDQPFLLYKNSTRMECKYTRPYNSCKFINYKNSTRMECKCTFAPSTVMWIDGIRIVPEWNVNHINVI